MGTASQDIDRAIARHPDQPRRHPASRGIVPLRLVPAAEKGVLDHFLGQLAVTDHPDRKGVQQRRVAVVERTERDLVALLQPPEQRLVGDGPSGQRVNRWHD